MVSALLQYGVLQRIKAGHKGAWLNGAWVSLVLGLAAVGIQIWQLTALPSIRVPPGSPACSWASGRSS